jgi:hypothetical protein
MQAAHLQLRRQLCGTAFAESVHQLLQVAVEVLKHQEQARVLEEHVQEPARRNSSGANKRDDHPR